MKFSCNEFIRRLSRSSDPGWRLWCARCRALEWADEVAPYVTVKVCGRRVTFHEAPSIRMNDGFVSAPCALLASFLLVEEAQGLYSHLPYAVGDLPQRFPIFEDLPKHGEPGGDEWDEAMRRARREFPIDTRLIPEPEKEDMVLEARVRCGTSGQAPCVRIERFAPLLGYHEAATVAGRHGLEDRDLAEAWYRLAYAFSESEVTDEEARWRQRAIDVVERRIYLDGLEVRARAPHRPNPDDPPF